MMRTICVLDEIDQQGNTITVTKRGRPVAIMQPVKNRPWKSPKNAWAGRVEIVGDIVGFDTSPLWTAPHKNQDKDRD